MATSTYELIETTTLSSNASSVTFSSITQDYRDLVLVFQFVASANGVNPRIRINGNASNIYYDVMARSLGSSYGAGAATQNAIRLDTVGTDATTGRSEYMTHFFDYSATNKHKSTLSRGNNPGQNATSMSTCRWGSTAAITSLTFFENGGTNLGAGTILSLYGIAG